MEASSSRSLVLRAQSEAVKESISETDLNDVREYLSIVEEQQAIARANADALSKNIDICRELIEEGAERDDGVTEELLRQQGKALEMAKALTKGLKKDVRVTA